MFFTLNKYNILCVFIIAVTLVSVISVYTLIFDTKTVSVTTNTVIIDAGHGGEDGGAVGKNGTKEKDLNLQIALKLKKSLIENGFNVILTRENDNMLNDPNETKHKKRSDLNNRVKISKKFDNAIFISIHMNYFDDSTQKGAQIFYSKNNEKSQILAKAIDDELKSSVDISNKRVFKPAGNEIFIMKHITLPACLIECGFISNREEEKLLADDNYQNKIVNAITCGIKNFTSY